MENRTSEAEISVSLKITFFPQLQIHEICAGKPKQTAGLRSVLS